jgi:ankyrin repeat protein
MLKRLAAGMLVLAIAVPAWAGAVEDKALRDAASNLDVAGVKSALKNGANPNSSDARNHYTLLGEVALANLRGLSNPPPAAKEAGFMEPEIIHSKALEITKLLFVAGAKLGPHDGQILYFPICRGNVELVRLLVNEGASVKARLDGYTPPELAKKCSQEPVYQLLVSHGGNPVDSRSSAQLVLVEAAGIHDLEAMKGAIKNGARINDFDAKKRTALNSAFGVIPIIGPSDAVAIFWLVDQGADPNLQDETGVPLHLLLAKDKRWFEAPHGPAEMTLLRLLEAGAKVSGVDSIGRTPLHIAAENDNVRAAEILIREGAKVMPRDGAGKTPLDYAESSAMIKLLKQNGATER